MVAVPAAIPEIAPVVELIVAIPGAEDAHVPPAIVDVNVELPPTQMAWVPDKVPALGAAVTVTVLVADALGHPPVPVTVYVIVGVPAPTPVITPVEGSTVANDVFDEVHVPPETVEENVVVNPTQTF